MSDLTETLNAFCSESPVALLIFMFIFGISVGSFLNVVALRSLKEQSILWPRSYCFSCKHQLSVLDNIPILAYLALGGKCRYCKAKISWQYPFVEFCTGLVYAGLAYSFLVHKIPLVNFDAMPVMGNAITSGLTHDLFSAIQQGRLQPNSPMSLNSEDLGFYKYGLFLSCLAFASTLIAVTITDFREKLIPHEITYPSMVIGIAFSALVRGDLLGAMAGIGASYMLFDFLAFYGLKIYMMTHGEDDRGEKLPRHQLQRIPRRLQLIVGRIQSGFSRLRERPQRFLRIRNLLPRKPYQFLRIRNKGQENEEDIEVMGGGDAVLSAVMSAYLGWKGLVLALMIGFLAGTVMGLILLFVEMRKAGLLKECGRKAFLWALIAGAAMGALPLIFEAMMSGISAGMQSVSSNLNLTLSTALFGATGGALIGMVLVGTRVSKPFPFGPALALGGFIAMFLIPYWLPFY